MSTLKNCLISGLLEESDQQRTPTTKLSLLQTSPDQLSRLLNSSAPSEAESPSASSAIVSSPSPSEAAYSPLSTGKAN